MQEFKQNLSSVCLFLPVLIVKVNDSEIKRNDDIFDQSSGTESLLQFIFLLH